MRSRNQHIHLLDPRMTMVQEAQGALMMVAAAAKMVSLRSHPGATLVGCRCDAVQGATLCRTLASLQVHKHLGDLPDAD